MDSSMANEMQVFSSVGSYKGTVVAIKRIDPSCITLSRHELLELKAVSTRVCHAFV